MQAPSRSCSRSTWTRVTAAPPGATNTCARSPPATRGCSRSAGPPGDTRLGRLCPRHGRGQPGAGARRIRQCPRGHGFSAVFHAAGHRRRRAHHLHCRVRRGHLPARAPASHAEGRGLFAPGHRPGYAAGCLDHRHVPADRSQSRYPRGSPRGRLKGRRWALGAGLAAGAAGGAVGLPGPPVVLYSTTQGWGRETIKANLQVFFFVNQVVILIGYWWAGLLTRDVWRLTASFVLPAAAGTAVGMVLLHRVDQSRFRRVVFVILFGSGVVLLTRG